MVLAVVNAPAILLQHTTLDGPDITTGILLLSLTGFLLKGPRSRMDFPQRTMLRHTVVSQVHGLIAEQSLFPQQRSQRNRDRAPVTISHLDRICLSFSPDGSST